MIQCLCQLISKVLEVIRADLPQTRRDKINEFTEQECGYLVRIRLNKIYKDKLRCFLGIWRPPTDFGGGCETGMVAKEKFPGDCKHGPQEFQLYIVHHGFEIQNQAVFAAGVSKKTEIRVRY